MIILTEVARPVDFFRQRKHNYWKKTGKVGERVVGNSVDQGGGQQLASSCRILLPPTTYDHTRKKTRDPVRSPLDKLVRVRLVLRSVTTGESLMLYVFDFLRVVEWHYP